VSEEELNSTKLTSLINQHKIGDKVAVEFYRGGERQEVMVTLQKRSE
jgi:S1-C subfamily serine protease